MKKIFVIFCAVMMIAATGAFAAKGGGLAIGGEVAVSFAGTGGLPVGAMLMLHLPQLPLMLGIGFTTQPAIGVTADYWFAHGPIASILDWYVGIGGYLTLNMNPNGAAVGARIPLALQIWPFGQNLELFLEAAPAFGIIVAPTGFEWHLQAALGLRYWF